jgi:hypothetical protein
VSTFCGSCGEECFIDEICDGCGYCFSCCQCEDDLADDHGVIYDDDLQFVEE